MDRSALVELQHALAVREGFAVSGGLSRHYPDVLVEGLVLEDEAGVGLMVLGRNVAAAMRSGKASKSRFRRRARATPQRRKVSRVPTPGMVRSTARKMPAMLPKVEIA